MTTSNPTPVWLDCDVGHDDALALLLAAYHPQIKLLGISAVAGNASLRNTTANAIRVLQAAGIEGVKVYPGASKPLVKPSEHAADIHGESGLDGTDLLPEPDYEKYLGTDKKAIEAIRDVLMTSEEPVTIVAVGPLTNIALLVSVYPEVVPKIHMLSVMGGAIALGNTTAAAEFNIYFDPEAAQIVLQAGIGHIAMVPLDVTHTVLASKAVIERINKEVAEPKFAKLLTDLLWFFGSTYEDVFGEKDGAPLHDPVAMAYVFMRDAFSERLMHVSVDCSQGPCNGRTVCDVKNKSKLEPNCYITTAVDVDRFWDVMIGALVEAAKRSTI
ncbi:hypothetical protein EC988_001377 [Linderina pennispora]|nr:hypothetical protein EC988_001377 [Linderina pennispora]